MGEFHCNRFLDVIVKIARDYGKPAKKDTPMDMTDPAGAEVAKAEPATVLPGQVVLAFQGGRALTAYQGGVYEALHEAGIEPDWVIGTSSSSAYANSGQRWNISRIAA